jgi:hypothetical protein
MAAMKPQVVNVRGKRYFICDYTGAPLDSCYFIPTGKDNRAKRGTFATLPIMMRAIHDAEGGVTENYKDIKKRAEAYFNQPDIPLHPVIHAERVPLSGEELAIELAGADMGLAWRKVGKARSVPRDRARKRPRPAEEEDSA